MVFTRLSCPWLQSCSLKFMFQSRIVVGVFLDILVGIHRHQPGSPLYYGFGERLEIQYYMVMLSLDY